MKSSTILSLFALALSAFALPAQLERRGGGSDDSGPGSDVGSWGSSGSGSTGSAGSSGNQSGGESGSGEQYSSHLDFEC